MLFSYTMSIFDPISVYGDLYFKLKCLADLHHWDCYWNAAFVILIDQLLFLIPIVHYDQINRIISFNL